MCGNGRRVTCERIHIDPTTDVKIRRLPVIECSVAVQRDMGRSSFEAPTATAHASTRRTIDWVFGVLDSPHVPLASNIAPMRRRPTIAAVLVFAASAHLLGQGSSTNPRYIDPSRVEITDRVIAISYDLTPASGRSAAPIAVLLEASLDGGATYPIKPVSISGDVGPDVKPGLGKRIIWQATEDVQVMPLDRFKFRIRAVAVSSPAPRLAGQSVARAPSGLNSSAVPTSNERTSSFKKKLFLISGFGTSIGAAVVAWSKESDLRKRVNQINALPAGAGVEFDRQLADARRVLNARNRWTRVAAGVGGVTLGYIAIKKVFDCGPVSACRDPNSPGAKTWLVWVEPTHSAIWLGWRF